MDCNAVIVAERPQVDWGHGPIKQDQHRHLAGSWRWLPAVIGGELHPEAGNCLTAR